MKGKLVDWLDFMKRNTNCEKKNKKKVRWVYLYSRKLVIFDIYIYIISIFILFYFTVYLRYFIKEYI